MNNYRGSVVSLCLYFLSVTSSAQQLTPKQPTQAPIAAASGPQSFTGEIRKSVAFLTVWYADGPQQKGIIGTCFFVMVLDQRLGENRGFIYLVTNRHVAQPGIDLGTPFPIIGTALRLNLLAPQGDIQSVQQMLHLENGSHWYFPRDEAVDLAILPIAPDQHVYSYTQIPFALLATAEQIRAGDVQVGDRVSFAGYFSNFPGERRIEPIVRQGVIAMMPEEKLDTTLHKPGTVYLADLHAFHGNSGSPVFVNVGGTPHGGTVLLGDKYFLLGVVSGYYPESAGYSVPAATVLTGEVHDNSGIATIVPAEEIAKILNSREVQAQRDGEVAVLSKKP